MSRYPDACIRGIRRKDHVRGGEVLGAAFHSGKMVARSDKGREVSVNWHDSEAVVQLTFADRMISEHGVALLDFEWLVTLRRRATDITWERAPIADNPHHGNIVYAESCSKSREKMLAGSMALACTYVPRPT